MFKVYNILTNILYPFLLILIFYRKIIRKEDSIRFKEKIMISHFNIKRRSSSKLIWFHAASIGEYKSIIPIINQLNLNHKNLDFLLTTSTLSSGRLAEIEFKNINNVEHRYFPLDVGFLIDNFLNLWKPDKIFLVDSEIWPNLVFKTKKYKIPIALINARLTSKSFRRWMLFPNVAREIFKIFNLFICSNEETKNYLNQLGLKNIHFKGNIKLADTISKNESNNLNQNVLMEKRFWFAASTHRGEDFFCLETHKILKKQYQDIVTIIAPRHIERSREIETLAQKLELNVQILNKNEDIEKGKEIIIINYFGALKTYFKHAKSVFIGKSMISKLKNSSGQSPIEAAKLNCKIYHGPYVYNFFDIYKILEENKISYRVESSKDLSKNLIEDLKNPKKNNFDDMNFIINLGQKILNDTMVIVEKFLNVKN